MNMNTCFETNCISCDRPLWDDTTIHHLMLGKRVLNGQPSSVLSMRPLMSLCGDCYTIICPTPLLKWKLEELIGMRSSYNDCDIYCYPEVPTVTCQGCYDEFPGDTPFYTLEHAQSIGKLTPERGEFLALDEIIGIELLAVICPICESRVDLLETALDALEITIATTQEVHSNWEADAANDPLFYPD